jgi:hypothetical protein
MTDAIEQHYIDKDANEPRKHSGCATQTLTPHIAFQFAW